MDKELLTQVTAKAQKWLDGNYSEETKAEVRRMLQAEDKTELIEAFYKDLEFGTGGLRGIMGVGSNRMNIYTVGAATQGLANYLNREFAHQPISVVIGHDCRNNSRLFAEISADIFSANGIKVYLFENLRPTPEVSFAIRYLKCQSGIILTASHNPKEYNGYKAYWSDGAQVIAPHDVNIISEVNKIKSPDNIKFNRNADLIQNIGEDIDKVYLEKIHSITLSPDAVKRHSDLKIVYTPIHGTGIKLIPRCLSEMGFTNVHLVEEQTVISGDFPTVKSPNPEEPAALKMAIELAQKIDADIVMASDPDADRLGIAIKNSKGEWILVNGNQTCLLFTYYILKRRSELGILSKTDYMVKTIVTTEEIRKVCNHFHTELFDCYTGFKWIASVVRENEGKKQYIGGGEESYGYMPADFIRDKDAVASSALMAEMVAWAADSGKSLYDVLMDIYIQFGYSKELGISVVRKGKEGAEEIIAMMKNYRNNPPESIGGSRVKTIKDYQLLIERDVASGAKKELDFPTTSNVLQYFTDDGTKVSVRPSGTEPKIKFYIEVQAHLARIEDIENVEATALAKIEAVRQSLNI